MEEEPGVRADSRPARDKVIIHFFGRTFNSAVWIEPNFKLLITGIFSCFSYTLSALANLSQETVVASSTAQSATRRSRLTDRSRTSASRLPSSCQPSRSFARNPITHELSRRASDDS